MFTLQIRSIVHDSPAFNSDSDVRTSPCLSQAPGGCLWGATQKSLTTQQTLKRLSPCPHQKRSNRAAIIPLEIYSPLHQLGIAEKLMYFTLLFALSRIQNKSQFHLWPQC